MGIRGGGGISEAEVNQLIDDALPIAISDVTNLQTTLDSKITLDEQLVKDAGGDTSSTYATINRFTGKSFTFGGVDDGYIYRITHMEVSFSTASFWQFKLAGFIKSNNDSKILICQNGYGYQNVSGINKVRMIESHWFAGGSNIYCGLNRNNTNLINHAITTNDDGFAETYSEVPTRLRTPAPDSSTKTPYLKVYYERRLAT